MTLNPLCRCGHPLSVHYAGTVCFDQDCDCDCFERLPDLIGPERSEGPRLSTPRTPDLCASEVRW